MTSDTQYDVFRFMHENDLAYGFNLAVLSNSGSFSSLLSHTKRFQELRKELIDSDADLDRLLREGKLKNTLVRSPKSLFGVVAHGNQKDSQFLSNLEIGSLDFFRGPAHSAYFQHLDRSGGIASGISRASATNMAWALDRSSIHTSSGRR